MIEYARISPTFRDDIGDNLFSSLLRAYPEGQTGADGHAFAAVMPLEDQRTQLILNLFTEAGFSPWADTSKPFDGTTEFNLRLQRVYDRSDFECAPYLELHPPPEAHVFDSPRHSDGLLRLLSGYLVKADIAFTDMVTCYAVPLRVKQALEAAVPLGIRFRPTLLIDGTYAIAGALPVPWENHGEPWWELDAEFTMPPLSDSMTFTDMDGTILKHPVFSNGFHRREGLQVHPELHYRKSDLGNLPFDIARTYEPFGNRRGYDRNDCAVVVSKRFYRLCLAQGVETGWVPVRVDPG